MKYFQKIADNVHTIDILHTIQRKDWLWNQNTLRTKHPGTAHREVSDIWIWFNDVINTEAVIDDKEVISYPAWTEIPGIRHLVFALMRQVEATRLGRVIITKLPPGKSITPHVDQGAPATYYTRYQIALQSLPGAIFQIGDEAVNFRTGEIWYINNRVKHSIINNSSDDRIIMIVDLKVD